MPLKQINPETIRISPPVPLDVIEKLQGVTRYSDATDIAHTRVNMEVLQSHDLPFKSPALKNKITNSEKTPYPHQLKGFNLTTVAPRCFLLFKMRTGKTATALWAAEALIKEGLVKSVLIVTTASIMHDTWGAQIFEYLPHRAYSILHGTKEKRKEILSRSKAIFNIINFDGVHVIQQELVYKAYDLVIIDECRAYANPSTRRWKALNKVIKPSARAWGLSGSPRSNSPEDVYGQIKLINPTRLNGITKTWWKDLTMRQVARFTWIERPTANDTIKKFMHPAVYASLEDALPFLPEKIETYRKVELSPSQRKVYKDIVSKEFASVELTTITPVNAAAKILKLLQVCAGDVYADEGAPLSLDNSPRIEALMDIIEEAEGRVLLYASFTSVIDALHVLLKNKGYAVIDGRTSIANRAKILQQIREGTVTGLIAMPSTLAHGVDASTLNTIVWFTPTLSAEHHEQANMRIVSPTQTRGMQIIYMYATEVEHHRYQQLQDKKQSQQNFLDLYKIVLDKRSTQV